MKTIEILKKIGALTVPTTAKEIMGSPVVAVKSSQTVGEAFELLKEKDVEQLAVVDDHNRLVGDIKRFAVLDAILDSGSNTTVEGITTTGNYNIFSPDTDLLEIRKALKEVPVVFVADDDTPVGVIKRGDFFKEYK